MLRKMALMLAELLNKFHNSEYRRRTPVVTPAILATAVGACTALCYRRNSLGVVLRNPLTFVRGLLFDKDTVPTIPSQEKKRPVILFDASNLLYTDRFSLSRFDIATLKRSYSEEFLFNTAHHYEIISVSDASQSEGSKALNQVDPFGCISYRIFVRDKKAFRKENLNRPLAQLAVITSLENEFHPDFERNTIRLERWTGKKDSVLLDMVHFFTNLHYMSLKDFRGTIESYRGSDFCASFQNTLKRLFRQRNLFAQGRFMQKLEEVNERKVRDYETARRSLMKLRIQSDSMRSLIIRILGDLMM